MQTEIENKFNFKTENNMATIHTKHGEFNAVDNGNGGTSLFVGDVKICEFPKVSWWNLDGLNAAVEEHHEIIEQRIAERVNKIEVTRDNADEVLEQLIALFGKEHNGFYASRLKQCLNKFRAA